jgi:DNA-binding CsgD family transcriptional regulator
MLASRLQWGERSKAEAGREQLARLAARTHNFMAIDDLSWADALFAMLDGRLREAMEYASRSAAASRGTVPHLWRGRIAAWTGDGEALEAAIRWTETVDTYFTPAFRAVLLSHQGRRGEAQRLIDDLAPRVVAAARRERVSLNATAVFLEAAVTNRDDATAQELLSVLQDDPRPLAFPSFVLVSRYLAGSFALSGKFAEAREKYLEAIAFCERVGFLPELALARYELAELLLRHFAAERVEALANLDQAAATFESIGMTPYLERAVALKASHHGREGSRRPAFPDGLSEREVEVLRLVAMGKTNQQIADDLFISLNTVLRHVSSIFNKTGSANRTEAANYARSNGLS